MSELTTKDVAATPWKVTASTPVKFVPEICTGSPTCPEVGENPLIAGSAEVTVKLVELVALAPGRATRIGPLLAPEGTVAVMSEWELTTKEEAEVPLKVTELTPWNSLPKICTEVPTGPDVGEKLLIAGCGFAASAGGPARRPTTITSAGIRAVSFLVRLRDMSAPARSRTTMDASEGNGCYQGHSEIVQPTTYPETTIFRKR
jgi:hypothetical protein